MTDKQYCCQEFKKFRSEPESPIVITRDLRVFYLGYHEVFRDNEPLHIKLKFCPFCGNKLSKNKDLN